MKRIITYSIIALLQASVSLAQTSVSLAKTSPKPKLQKREKYEWQGEIPTYVETLKKELTYPMAWGNSPIKNFKKWKKTARAKVFECMMTPPKAAAAWDMEVLGEEQRDGYKAQKIAFNINAYSRITAYLLIPDGKGPFPTVYNPQNEMFSHFGTKRYNFKNETQLFKVIPHTSKNQKKSTGFAGTKYI
ncbi:alpha/beta hydrolase family protein [Segatella copri]|uniref:alpha/beta hydrolase family protein n=1 Tax=Segatella copri TaxID=165179 RepID=UPI001D179A69|nr:alpha/beta hydrolase family protein [Segatella copri]